MSVAANVFALLVFPGALFLVTFAFAAQYLDRKLYARFQNRVGPPPIQPVADFVKLLSKESVVPDQARAEIFAWAPLFGLAGVLTAALYLPIWGDAAVFAFQGDLVVVLFLLALPSFALFFGGWYSGNPFSRVGTLRTLTQLFGYEVPFFLACLAPALATGTWETSAILQELGTEPWYLPLLAIGFVVAIFSLLAKLERVPFDAPEAETELASGTLAEYSGRKLALLKLTKDIELVVGALLLVSLFLGGPYPLHGLADGVAGNALGFLAVLVKALVVIVLLTVVRSVVARLRIEQTFAVFYRWLVGAAIFQVTVVLAVGAVLGNPF